MEPVKAPREYITRFGVDAVRYYLLRAIPPSRDGDFSEKGLSDVYTSDLANGLGNLCTRLTTLCERAELAIPRTDPKQAHVPPSGVRQALNSFRLDRVLDLLWTEITRLNREIAGNRPWEALRNGPTAGVQTDLIAWAKALRNVVYWLSPVLPQTAETVLACLDASRIRKCPPLFPRLR